MVSKSGCNSVSLLGWLGISANASSMSVSCWLRLWSSETASEAASRRERQSAHENSVNLW